MPSKESRALRFLYHTVPGRVVLRILISPVISKVAGVYMNTQLSKIHIKGFIKRANIDMSLYEETDYASFNDFFTRKIKLDVRPLAESPDSLASPCDGKMSVYNIERDSTFKIKNSRYSVADLIGDELKAEDFEGGTCVVFRLCVDDYHRYGYVDDGEIISRRHMKGKLHTVRPIALAQYPVFVQNTRECTMIETKTFGMIAQIEVGALMIGRIENYKKRGEVSKGEEKGKFLYGGSTIVLLFKKRAVSIAQEYFDVTERDEEIPVKFRSEIGRKGLNI